MDFSQILELLETLGAVVALVVFFFFYFRSPKFKAGVNKVLKFLPLALKVLAGRVKDTPGVFDKHDALMVMSRVSDRIRTTVQDPTNTAFEDVEDEVFEIVRDELAKYAGMPGVPDLEDPAIKTQVQVVFEAVKRAMSEDPA